MKKQIFTLGLMLAATFTLTNCDKISDNEPVAKNDFTIFATPASETKTVNDGMTSSWVADDAISVMHAVAGTTNYINDGKFVVAEDDVEDGRFTGELAEALVASKSYDWYMIYPYSGKMEDPVNDGKCFFYVGRGASSSQTQNGNDSMDHLSGSDVPLYGTVKGLSGSTNPAVTMHHLCAAVAFNLTNNSGKDVTVSSIEFTSTEPIVGTYYINIVDEPVYVSSGETYVSNTAKLAVSGGTAIKNGNSAKFYMAIKPHTVAKGGKMSVRVTTSAGVFEKEISASSAATFEAGKIQTLNVNYTGGNVDQKDHGATTVAAFIAAPESTDDWYQLTGTISNLKAGDAYGNFDLTDATGSVYVYGVLSEKGGEKKLFQELVSKYGIANGGTITIKATRGSYDDKVEAMNAYFISYKPGDDGGNTGGGDGVFDSKISWTLGANAYDQKANINGEEVAHILKLGTSSKVGTATLTIPAGVKKIGFYAIGWKGTNPTLTVGDESMAINGNDGATGNPTYTITVTDNDYHEVDVSSGSVEVTCDGRVLIFGINPK